MALSGVTTGELSWRRLGVLVAGLPSDCCLARTVSPGAVWSTEAHLLAGVIDNLAWANWQRSGKKNAPKPRPVQRPGTRSGTETVKGTSRTPADFEAVYARAQANVASREARGEVVWQSR